MRTLLMFSCLMLASWLRAASLPDTGQQLCWDGAGMVACTAANVGDEAAFPGQDGRFGHDAAATAGYANKIGGGDAGFDYTRVCNSGDRAGQGSCPATPSLGPGANEWGCTLDNITGLMWEVKVNDSAHLRHKLWTYSWFSSDDTANGGEPGAPNAGECIDSSNCDTEKYMAAVNVVGLCGHSDWRLPSLRELRTLSHFGRYHLAIDPDYFPNTPREFGFEFWSSTPYIWYNEAVWAVSFLYGNAFGREKLDRLRVRLVRNGRF